MKMLTMILMIAFKFDDCEMRLTVVDNDDSQMMMKAIAIKTM